MEIINANTLASATNDQLLNLSLNLDIELAMLQDVMAMADRIMGNSLLVTAELSRRNGPLS